MLLLPTAVTAIMDLNKYPFKTIGKAASVMSSGDKCYIGRGAIMKLLP